MQSCKLLEGGARFDAVFPAQDQSLVWRTGALEAQFKGVCLAILQPCNWNGVVVHILLLAGLS
jgi:hypothetical protein